MSKETKKQRWEKKDNPVQKNRVNCPYCNSRKWAFYGKESHKGLPKIEDDGNGNLRAGCRKCGKDFSIRVNEEKRKLETVNG